MEIWTTYFSNVRSLPDNTVPISICGRAPSWWTGKEYRKLAPKWDFFQRYKETGDQEYYIKNFDARVLAPLNTTMVLSELSSLSDGKDIALVCYEKPGNFCHRHLVAQWIMKNTNYTIKEWQEQEGNTLF